MRTEQLLRDTLTDLADRARPPEVTLTRVLARIPARPARRRRLVLVLAAILVLALAVAVPTVVNRAGEPVGRVPGNWNLNHRVEVPEGWEIKTQFVTPDSESTSFGPPGNPDAPDEVTDSCEVTLWARGRGDPTADSPQRTPVVVNGRPGFWADDSDAAAIWGVSWEYQRGAYAQVSCAGGRAEELAAAERVRFERVRVRLPFRLRSLPEGYRAQVVAPPRSLGDEFLGGVQFSATAAGPDRPDFDVVMSVGRNEVRPGLAGYETTTIAGRPAVVSALDQRVCLNLEGHTACVQANTGAGEPRSVWAAGRREFLVDIAERLAFSRRLDRPDRWFPVERAIPD